MAKKMFPKLLAVGLSLVVCLSLLHLAAFAGDNHVVGYCPECGRNLSNSETTSSGNTPTCKEHNIVLTEAKTDPVDPADPVDPVDPIDPVGPVDPVSPIGPSGVEVDDNDTPLADMPDDNEIEIGDDEVPLAGLMTRAEFVNYLYVQAGRPEAELSDFTDVAEDYEYAMAIGWAQANGIAKGISETEFAPGEIVTVGQARLFLARYAAFSEIEMPELAALAGKGDEEILDNADEALAEFFGEEPEG